MLERCNDQRQGTASSTALTNPALFWRIYKSKYFILSVASRAKRTSSILFYISSGKSKKKNFFTHASAYSKTSAYQNRTDGIKDRMVDMVGSVGTREWMPPPQGELVSFCFWSNCSFFSFRFTHKISFGWNVVWNTLESKTEPHTCCIWISSCQSEVWYNAFLHFAPISNCRRKVCTCTKTDCYVCPCDSEYASFLKKKFRRYDSRTSFWWRLSASTSWRKCDSLCNLVA